MKKGVVLILGASDLAVEVLSFEQRVDLHGSLGSVREGTLGTLAGSTQAAESAGVTRDVLKAC
jgi:hypothetical protein